MTNANDPAFSTTCESMFSHLPEDKRGNMCCGLTKRELFAAIAMQGLLANEKIMEGMALAGGKELEIVSKGIALMAISKADALIAELNKEIK